MEPSIMVKCISNAFANNEAGIEVTLFRHKILLTTKEANDLNRILSGKLSMLDIEDKENG
jgi:hypothetical protein